MFTTHIQNIFHNYKKKKRQIIVYLFVAGII